MANNNNRRRKRTRQESNVKDLKVKSYQNESSKDIPKNDPDWYIYDKEMFNGVISMPTLEFKGKSIPWYSNGGIHSSVDPTIIKMEKLKDVPLSTPTVAGYLMNPGLEFCSERWEARTTKYTAINVAARKMYAELSASNAKTSQYAPQDIATLILALGQIIAMLSHLKRMYGIANHFNFYSRRIPNDLFEAMGVTHYNILSQNLATFRSKVNQLIARVDTIQFPTGLSYFKKCEYIYQNVFVDRDEQMVTYHVMAPYSTWKLDEESYQEGSILKTVICANRSYESILTEVEGMIERILTSSTFNTIFADIINLANRNVLNTDTLHIDMLPIDYAITPIYSEQFNWQIMNMSILPFPNVDTYTQWSTPANDVYPDVDFNTLLYAPRFVASSDNDGVYNISKYYKQIPIRLPDTNPSQDLFVELLAYTAIPNAQAGTVSGNTEAYVNLENLPDYWCNRINVTRPSDKNTNVTVMYGIESNGLSYNQVYQIAVTSQFVHFPFMYMIDTYPASAETWAMPISRLSAYTQVNNNALANLRYQTFLGLFSFKR